MDVFKTKPGLREEYPISEENFTKVTKRKEPYIKQTEKEDKYYAVCPECDNPIIIVGLLKKTKESGRKPYGRHHKGSILGLAEYNERDYRNCSYSMPRWKKPRSKRRADSKMAKEILKVLKEQYDRVIYILEKDIEIKITKSFAEELLCSYIRNKAWLNYNSTPYNLPWKLLEASRGCKLFGRKIKKNGRLHEALLLNCSGVLLQESEEKRVKVMCKKGKFLDIDFYFTKHIKDIKDDHLHESIEFVVAEGSAPDIREIYRKKIEIQKNYLVNLINLPEHKGKRNEEYLEIARRLLSGICGEK